ncbi:MAG: IPT/TIG domain-containing protein, partial [Akkermansiaceae bacterium]|nr:IPT/TIG domain-containing protein [Akkermansiaceae bacterium]
MILEEQLPRHAAAFGRQQAAVVALLLAAAASAAASPRIEDYTPRAAVPGGTLVLTGSGFGTSPGVVSATIGGVPAAVASVNDNAVSLTAPEASGPIVLSVNGETTTAPGPFFRLRALGGTLSPPPGVGA